MLLPSLSTKEDRGENGRTERKVKVFNGDVTSSFLSGPSGCYSDQNKALSLPSFGIVNCFCSPLQPLFLIVQLFLDGCALRPPPALLLLQAARRNQWGWL